MALTPISSASAINPINPNVVQNARDSFDARANQINAADQQRLQMQAQLDSYNEQLAQAQAALAQYTQNVQQIQQQITAVQQRLGISDANDNSDFNRAQNLQNNPLNPTDSNNPLNNLNNPSNALNNPFGNLNNPLTNPNSPLNSQNNLLNNPSNPLNPNNSLLETNNDILGARLQGNNAVGIPGVSTLANTAIANSIIPPANNIPVASETTAATLAENAVAPSTADDAGRQIDTLI